jgi:hypothetical protein
MNQDVASGRERRKDRVDQCRPQAISLRTSPTLENLLTGLTSAGVSQSYRESPLGVSVKPPSLSEQ